MPLFGWSRTESVVDSTKTKYEILVSYKMLNFSSRSKILTENSSYNFGVICTFSKNIKINSLFMGLFGLHLGYQGYLRNIYKSEFLISQIIQQSYIMGLNVGVKNTVPLSKVYSLTNTIKINGYYLMHNRYVEFRNDAIKNSMNNAVCLEIILQRKFKNNNLGLGLGIDYNSYFKSYYPSINTNFSF